MRTFLSLHCKTRKENGNHITSRRLDAIPGWRGEAINDDVSEASEHAPPKALPEAAGR